MATLLDEEHLTIILGVLDTDWNNANTSYSSDPRFSTGWWDWGRDVPSVTVTNPQVNPASVAQNPTGATYMTGDGRVGQRQNGFCLVNAWGGTFDTDALATEGPGGDRLSPKILAWEMCKEVRRILLSYAEGTTTSSGDVELTFLMPGETRRIVESDEEQEHPTLFRYEVECRFGYNEES